MKLNSFLFVSLFLAAGIAQADVAGQIRGYGSSMSESQAREEANQNLALKLEKLKSRLQAIDVEVSDSQINISQPFHKAADKSVRVTAVQNIVLKTNLTKNDLTKEEKSLFTLILSDK